MPREGTKKYADPPRTQHCSITHRIVTKVMGNLLITFRKQVGSGPTCAVINSHHTRRLRQWRCFPSPLAYAYTSDWRKMMLLWRVESLDGQRIRVMPKHDYSITATHPVRRCLSCVSTDCACSAPCRPPSPSDYRMKLNLVVYSATMRL